MDHSALSSTFPLTRNFSIITDFLRRNILRNVSVDDLPGLGDFSQSLNLTPQEICVFAVIYDSCDKNQQLSHPYLVKLTQSLYSYHTDILDILNLFQKTGLVEKHDHRDTVNYKINYRIVKKIRKNNAETLVNLKPIGLERVIEYFNDCILANDNLDLAQVASEFEFIQDLNPDLSLVKNAIIPLETAEAFLVFATCTIKYFYGIPFDTSMLKNRFYFDRNVKELLYQIVDETLSSIRSGYLQISGVDLIGEEHEIELTKSGIDYFLKEMDEKSVLRLREKRLPAYTVSADAIPEVNLLFDDHLQAQVRDLEMLVMPDFYQKFLDSLPAGSRLRGLTVLLHGAPGTGKTELALQLARRSNRAMFRIDVSQVLSKWVGDSEKNLRAQLREYRRYQTENVHAPILFLNECDQLLSRRLNVTQSVDQMRNTMQNMLLEELETFEGILIATTNLLENLDSAFERRFLYKVRFPQPSSGLLAQLWKLSIPDLSDEQAKELSLRFPLSPGEQQNVATKLRLRRLLNPELNEYDTVLELCKDEKWGAEQKAMGFKGK